MKASADRVERLARVAERERERIERGIPVDANDRREMPDHLRLRHHDEVARGGQRPEDLRVEPAFVRGDPTRSSDQSRDRRDDGRPALHNEPLQLTPPTRFCNRVAHLVQSSSSTARFFVHYFGTALCRARANVRSVPKLLGHSKVLQT
ncbi:MAG TPA: hypothetical protein VK459_07545 [Polyangiaceae bacterium]|nr:hypothetical protein [Polyangiaceae bacterium]